MYQKGVEFTICEKCGPVNAYLGHHRASCKKSPNNDLYVYGFKIDYETEMIYCRGCSAFVKSKKAHRDSCRALSVLLNFERNKA